MGKLVKFIKSKYFIVPVLFITIAMFGLFALHSKYSSKLYIFTFHPVFIILIMIGMAYGVLLALNLRFFTIPKQEIKRKLLKVVYFIVFLPVVLFPIFKCYFRIPFVFCHVCPRKCTWGYLRSFTVPSVLLMNAEKRLWCYNFCPFGALQDNTARFRKKRIRIKSWIRWGIRLIILVALIALYFIIKKAKQLYVFGAENLYTYMFKNVYSTSLTVMIVAGVILFISFFIYRVWCSYVCPIGTCSDLILKVEKKLRVL